MSLGPLLNKNSVSGISVSTFKVGFHRIQCVASLVNTKFGECISISKTKHNSLVEVIDRF